MDYQFYTFNVVKNIKYFTDIHRYEHATIYYKCARICAYVRHVSTSKNCILWTMKKITKNEEMHNNFCILSKRQNLRRKY